MITSSPKPPRRFKRFSRRIAIFVAVAGLASGAFASWRHVHAAHGTTSSAFYTVVPTDLDIVIREEGELQAVSNQDIVCPVEGWNTIKSLIPEGTMVKKDDVLAELDASEMKKRLHQAILDVKKVTADWNAAKVQVDLQKSKNTAELETANVELKLAKIDLKSYTEGIYPQALEAAQRDTEMAKISVQDKRQQLQESKALAEKGFITSSDVHRAEVELLTAQSDLDKKTIDLKVLTDYTHEKDLAARENTVAQAEKAIQRKIIENDSNLNDRVTDMQGKEQVVALYQQALDHIQQQVDACTIKSPGNGVVIYGSTVLAGLYRDNPMQAGSKIADQQLLVRLPDTTKMKAVAKIPEAMAMKLRDLKNQPQCNANIKIVGLKETVPATVTTVAMLPDNSNLAWDPDRKEYPVDLTLSQTPPNLKPGVSARVEIVLQHLAAVLAAPLGAVYSENKETYVFVRQADKIVARKVSVGDATDTLVHITGGVSSGDQLMLLQAGEGRKLLEKSGIPKPSAQTPASNTAVARL